MPDQQPELTKRVRRLHTLFDEAKRWHHRKWILQDKITAILRKLDYAEREKISEMLGVVIEDKTNGEQLFSAAGRQE